MPAVHLPDGRIVHFQASMTPDQITAEVGRLGDVARGTRAPAAAPERSWTDTAVDLIPAAGGFVGSLVGAGKWNPLGMAGAAAGGAGGEFVRQIVEAARGKDDVPTSLSAQLAAAATEGATQAGLEGGGRAVLGAGARVLKGVQRLAPAAAAALRSPAAKSLATDVALDLVPGGRTMRTAARTAVRAVQGSGRAAEAATPAVEAAAARSAEPAVAGLDRYMPNVSAASAPPARAAMNGPTVRALSEGEQHGIDELDRYFTHKYGTEDFPTRGNGTYREADAATPDASPLLDAMHGQAALSKAEPPAVRGFRGRLTPPSNPDVDFERGRELGRLLQKLASGRGGL